MSRDPTIFYHSYSNAKASGGQKHNYEHVDILTSGGFDATIVQAENGPPLDWFPDQTKVVSEDWFRSNVRPDRDFIVVPEDLGSRTSDFPGRLVIFNKNVFHGFRAYGTSWQSPYAYHSDRLEALFAVSDHNRRVLSYAFPGTPVFLLQPSIDHEIFFVPVNSKRNKLAWSSKNVGSALSVLHMLNARAIRGKNDSNSLEWVRIDGMTQADVAKTLQESVLLLFLSHEEGLGRLPLEAAMCGCKVIRYEIPPIFESLSLPAASSAGDLCSVVRAMEEALELRGANDVAVVNDHLAKAVAARFSKEKQRTAYGADLWLENRCASRQI